MFSRISEICNRKVHCILKNDKKASRSESGPLFQPLPEASDDEGPSSGIRCKKKVEDVDLEELWKHIYELRKLIDEGNDQKRLLDDFQWPNVPGLQDLKRIVVLRSDLTITDIHGDIKETLGRVNVATVAPLVVAQTLERFDASIANRALWRLTRVMYYLAIALKKLSESPGGTQDVMQEATALIVEGARVFSRQRGPLKGGPPRSTSEVSAIIHKLKTMYKNIKKELPVRAFTPMPQRRRSHLSNKYAHLLEKYSTHAGAPRCDEAPSEGQDVDVNLNISGAPRCDEAPSSSSSSGPTKSRSHLISSKRKYKVEDVNLDRLWKHIFELRKSREKGDHKKARSLGPFTWPDVPGLQKLKEMVSSGTDIPIGEIYGAVQAILKEIGTENVAAAAPLVVACALERLDGPYTHREEFRDLVNKMYDLAIVLKTLSESPEETQVVMEEATALIVEGAHVFSLQGGHRRSASEVRAIIQKLDSMRMHITTKWTVFTPIQHQRRSHLCKEYPTHADNGQVEEDLLVPEPQKAYIVKEDLVSTWRPKVFKMEDLEVATGNFDKANKVGEGGFGAVYEGILDGKQIAVKKMSFTSDGRRREVLKKQFENEKLLAEVQHRNLVNLLGSCEQESQWFLVYEYLRNKSLDQFLFDPQNRKRLDWHKRYNIILGIARGLLYLHQDSRVRIVHRDIKASNILLDDELNPQIADFGTANILPENKTHVTATSPAGTIGYMPPEYFMTRQFSVRTDVYSFGILLLEILTGKKISSNALKFLGWVWRLYNTKEALQTIDPTIIETWDIETRDKEATKALRCIQVGLLCIQGDSRLRPTMAKVIAMLSTDESLPDPKNPPCLPSYCATQEKGNSAMEKLMSFMRAIFESRIGKIDAQAIT